MANMETKERDILLVMRKVLTTVIREITPQRGKPYPLSDGTVRDVQECLRLIALRERELADAAGTPAQRPYYQDPAQGPKVVPIDSIKKRNDDDLA
jgi:hypothetical protein